MGQVPILYLDANILLPEYLRSCFLDLAHAGLAHVHWGPQVLVEVERNLLKPRFGQSAATIQKLFRNMARAFPDALVQGSRRYETQFAGKTDAKDQHVAAGALKLSKAVYGGQPVVLVTSNMRDLPQAAFAGTTVRSARPNLVLKEMLAVNPEVATALEQMLVRFKAPPMTKEDLLAVLDASSCSEFAIELARAWGMVAE